MIDKIDEILDYEAQQQIEYMIQDAFGAPSFDELTRDNIQVLKESIEEMGESTTISTLEYLIDRWEEDNVE
jgi:hypothetical protein